MSEARRPFAVLVVSCLFLLIGVLGLAFQFHQLSQPDGVWIICAETLAMVAGVFMLRGHNWARWLAVAWLAFHVGISAFGDIQDIVFHCLIAAGITWLLLRSDARQYFRRPQPTQA